MNKNRIIETFKDVFFIKNLFISKFTKQFFNNHFVIKIFKTRFALIFGFDISIVIISN